MVPMRTAPPRLAVWFLLLAAAWAYSYRLGTPALFDDPNDAQYAEVAREMVETGEWISPQLDYVLFLNKPPLSYWLIGLSFEAFGVDEFAARLPGMLTALVLLVLVWRLGCVLFDAWGGWYAAGVSLATAGILLEARTVRPDLLLTTGIAGALWAATRLAVRPQARGALIGWQVALAVALLAKGIVGLLIPAAAIAMAMLAAGDYRFVRTLLHPRAWWLFALLVVPWHAVVAWRHPGFFSDYIVNQHLLFFLDRKLPRDSEGIPLWQFWAIFGLRLFPWTLFLPLALWRAWPRAGSGEQRWAGGLLLGWAAAVLLLFSATASRLEHYSIPALPACALLIGALFARLDRARLLLTAAHVLPLLVLGVAALFVLPHVLATADWLAPSQELPALARTAALLFTVGALAALIASVRPSLTPLPLMGVMCAMVVVIHRGLALVAPLDSSAPVAAVINRLASDADTLVYEAPTEYQSGAGLFFYTRRKWWVLRPQRFVAPPYLVPHESELFLPRAGLERLWADGHVFFVSDPLVERPTMKGFVPEPFWIVAHSGTRWVVTNDRP